MRTDVAAANTLLQQAVSNPVSRVYSEQHMPVWTHVRSEGSSNALGHDAKIITYDNTQHLFRVRVEGNAVKYIHRSGTELGTLSNWDCTSTMPNPNTPMAASVTKATDHCAQIAIAASDGQPDIWVLWFTKQFYLMAQKYNLVSRAWSNLHMVAMSGLAFQWGVTALQVAAPTHDRAYATEMVTTSSIMGYATYGTQIRSLWCNNDIWRVSDAGWPLRYRWYFNKMYPTVGGTIWTTTGTPIWGLPVYGGLGAVPMAGDDLVLTSGFNLDSLGYNGSESGVWVFKRELSSGHWWRQGAPVRGDYSYANEGYRFLYSMARASVVKGQVWATWLHEEESTDLDQTTSAELVPRTVEVVYSRSLNGRDWTEPQMITANGRGRGTGPIVLVENTGVNYLYMVGYKDLFRSVATHIVEDLDKNRTDISHLVRGWNVTQTGRGPDAAIELDVDGNLTPQERAHFDENRRITIEVGDAGAPLVTLASGIVDTASPAFSVNPPESSMQVVALVAGMLQDTRYRTNSHIARQTTSYIAPSNIDQWVIDSGAWTICENPTWARWANLSGNFVRIDSHDVQTNLWHQMCFFVHPPCVDGAIELSVRMGTEGQFKHKQGNAPDGVEVTKDAWGPLNGVFRYKSLRAPATGYDPAVHDLAIQYVNGYPWRYGLYQNSFPDDKFRTDDGWGLTNYSAIGVTVRTANNKNGYVFAWEAGMPEWNQDSSMNWPNDHDKIDVPGYDYAKKPGTLIPTGISSRLVLYEFFQNPVTDSVSRRVVAHYSKPVDLVLGYPLRMKVLCHGRSIYCYYRKWNQSKKDFDGDWVLAMHYTQGDAMGAGSFGFYGRGFQGGVGYGTDPAHTAKAWVWDAMMYDTAKVWTLDDAVRNICWKAGVEIETKTRVPDGWTTRDGITLADTSGTNPIVEANPIIDANATVSSSFGFVVRALTDANKNPISFVGVGLSNMTGAWRFSVWGSGLSGRSISTPIPWSFAHGAVIPLRVAVIDEWYSLWIGDALIASLYFPFRTWTGTGGLQVGHYGSTFADFTLSELSEPPWVVTMDANASVLETLNSLLAQRRIKRFMRYNGKLKLGYFLKRDQAATMSDTVLRVSRNQVNRFISECRVDGARGWATYKSPRLSQGRYFRRIDMPDIFDRWGMYREAQLIVRDSGEMLEQCNFVGLPHLAIEPEDEVTIVVTDQGISDDYIVDDIRTSFSLEGRSFTQQIGTRQRYIE
jgi:hypothetical protein